MQEVDFTRPSSEDFEDWQDMEHDAAWFGLCETVLACNTGDVSNTDARLFDLTQRGEVCENDLCMAFDFFAEVARGEVEVDEDFKARVEALLNVYKSA
jgi:hypothetical protein